MFCGTWYLSHSHHIEILLLIVIFCLLIVIGMSFCISVLYSAQIPTISDFTKNVILAPSEPCMALTVCVPNMTQISSLTVIGPKNPNPIWW